MRVFVAGATGVLGKRVVKRLVERGHQVTGLARNRENEQVLASMGAEFVRADIFDRDAMVRCAAGHDAVLHLATSIPKKNRPFRKDWAMNDLLRTKGVENLIHASLANKTKVYIQESIIHLYGDRNGGEVDEQTRLASEVPFSLRSALTMERIIRRAMDEQGLPAIILRFGGFYGSDAHNSRMMIDGVRTGKMPIIGKGNAVWNLIHLDDAASAVVLAVERHEGNTGRVFNIVDDRPVTMKELLYTIAEMTGSKRLRSVSAWLARLAMGKDAMDFLSISVRASNRAARETLGWEAQYPTLRDGLKQILQGTNQNTSLRAAV